ncbi:tetratricopeptide repeat-containing sensor histidine kinase [Ekhidna sp.]|uniref:tetratricopeptide repeat-containing sensor histidine kinase n=1 Tax=Ekhidna sp. TaxID=2608089 RepID=UPI003CCC4414
MKFIVFLSYLLAAFISHAQPSIIDSLKTEIGNANADSSKVKLYLKLHDELRLSNFNEAAKIARLSYNLSQKINWDKGIASTGRNFGIALNLLGKYDSAELILNEAIKSSEEINDVSNIGYCYMTLGNIQYDQTNYDEALKFYFKSLETYEPIENYVGMSSALIWIGIIYQYAKSDYESAIATYMDALKYSDLGNSSLNKSYIYSNLATIYYNEYEYDSALTYYQRSHEIKKRFNDQRGIGNDYNNIGNVWYELKKYDSALFNYEKSLSIRREMNDQTGVASALINMGKVYSDLELNQEAGKKLTEGYNVAKKVEYKEAWQQASLLLSMLYEKQGQFKNALKYHKEYKSISDSIFNIASDRSIAELQTQYETEKKEQQIELQEAQLAEQEATISRNRIALIAAITALALLIIIGALWRNRIRKKQQLKLQQTKLQAREAEIKATISSQEKERARYARDLHDGFGQMISVLNMNLKNLNGNAKPDERHKVFETSSKVIDEMYVELKNICFDLMPQTLIKHGLESALKEFSDRINQTGNITIELNVFGLNERLEEVQEISIYRICQEWINNILKYADADKVTLQITRDEGEITLLIEDNGSGFDKNLLVSGKGNGWKNLLTRTNLIHGNLELETEPGKKGNVLIVNAPSEIKQTEQEKVMV